MSLEAFQAANLQQQALADELRQMMAAGAQAKGQQAPAIVEQERINQLRKSNMAQIPGAPGYANVSIGGGLADMMAGVRADQMQEQLNPVLQQTAQAIAQAETAPQLFEAASALPEANRAEALRLMQREDTLADAAADRKHGFELQNRQFMQERAMQAADAALQRLLQSGRFTQEKSMQAIEAELAKELKRMGFDHDTSMQTARLTANAALQEDQQAFQTSERVAGQEYQTGERAAGQDFEKELLADEQAYQTATGIEERSQEIFDAALKRQQDLEDAERKANEVAGDVEVWGDPKTGELSYAVRTANAHKNADNMEENFTFAGKTRIPNNDTGAWNAATTEAERLAAGSEKPMTQAQIQSSLNNIRKPTQDLGALVQAANAIDAQLKKWAEEGRTDIPGVGFFTGGEGVFSALARKAEDKFRDTEGANFAVLLQVFNNQKIRESAGLSQTLSERMAALREMGAAPLSFEEQFALAWAQQTAELKRRLATHRRTVTAPVQDAYNRNPLPDDPLNVFTDDYEPIDTSILDRLTSASITDTLGSYMGQAPSAAPPSASALPQSTQALTPADPDDTPPPGVPADVAEDWAYYPEEAKAYYRAQVGAAP